MPTRTDAEIEKEERDRKARQLKQDRERFDRGVTAAEAVILALGFKRATGKDYFTKEGRAYAKWHLETPRIQAHLDLQSKPYFSSHLGAVNDHEDRYTYRLVVSADYAAGIKDIRVAPGNREAVVDFIARAKAGLQSSEDYERKVAKLANDARDLIKKGFPNLKITTVDAEDDRIVIVRVKARSGAQFAITLNGSLKFLSLKVTADEDRSASLDVVCKALESL